MPRDAAAVELRTGGPPGDVDRRRDRPVEKPLSSTAPGKDDTRAAPPEAAAEEPPPHPLVAAARKQVGKTTVYDSRYVVLEYPGGDIPRERGVCTDVVIRALRDGLEMDLQKLVHEDMKAAFRSYPRKWGLRKPDPNIDHRRVANLRKYFERQGHSVPATQEGRGYRAGDIVTCKLPGNRTHIMIVSDGKSPDGTPLVIHNIGRGTREEDCLLRFPVTGHYRIGSRSERQPRTTVASYKRNRSVHVYVALADNESQGIVPVPARLGDGDDHANNLYWGAMYGVKAFLKKSRRWESVVEFKNPEKWILERSVFRHTAGNTVLTADAYRGSEIRRAISDFLAAAGGADGVDLAVYVGHNGLMDFTLESRSRKARNKGADAIVLACESKPYFTPLLTLMHADPVLLTTGAMAPEAYTLEAAVEGWILDEPAERIRKRAAIAYNKYQKCSIDAANRLFYCD